MYIGPAAYHPHMLLKSLRIKRESDRAKAEEAAKAAPPPDAPSDSAASAEQVKPKREGLAGILDDAESYLQAAEGLYKKMYDKYVELQNLHKEALNVKIDDRDRKKLHEQFIVKRKELDALAKEGSVKGDTLFSGKFDAKPRTIQIGEAKEEAISIRFDAHHAQGLQLDRVRIDSMVGARKGMAQIDFAGKKLDDVKNSIRSKLNTVEYKLRQIQEQEDSEKATTKSNVQQVGEEGFLNKSYYLFQLKEEQQIVAQAKGRDLGLLVNIMG